MNEEHQDVPFDLVTPIAHRQAFSSVAARRTPVDVFRLVRPFGCGSALQPNRGYNRSA